MKRLIIFLILPLVLTGCQVTKDEPNTEPIKEVEETVNKDLDKQNDKGETDLLVAVHDNDIETAKALIDQGANVNVQDSIQDSPYLYAGAQGRTEILEYMIEHASIDHTIYNRYGGNAIIPAAEKGHLETVKVLVAYEDEDINHQNNFGYTALIEAVALTDGSQVFQDIVRVLLDHGADRDLVDNNGKTALDYARQYQYQEMIEMLEQ